MNVWNFVHFVWLLFYLFSLLKMKTTVNWNWNANILFIPLNCYRKTIKCRANHTVGSILNIICWLVCLMKGILVHVYASIWSIFLILNNLYIFFTLSLLITASLWLPFGIRFFFGLLIWIGKSKYYLFICRLLWPICNTNASINAFFLQQRFHHINAPKKNEISTVEECLANKKKINKSNKKANVCIQTFESYIFIPFIII